MVIFWNVAGIIAAYLIGSISASIWIGKLFYKKDIRNYGSGNAGATNAFRVLGNKTGLFVLLFDAFKGWVAILLALITGANFVNPEYFHLYQLAMGLAALIGHVFPLYTGFKGGKGVATSVGILAALFPLILLVLMGVFLIIFLLTRYVSLGSITCAILFPFLVIFVFQYESLPLIVFSCVIAIFVPAMHHKNIYKLLKGRESKMYFNKKYKNNE